MEAGIEAFDATILPRAPRLHVGGLCADGGDPLLAPPLTGYLSHPILPDRISYRSPLRNKNIDLPQLGDDLFRRVLLPWHVLILLDAIRHTSSRTTSTGVEQKMSVRPRPADLREASKQQKESVHQVRNFFP